MRDFNVNICLSVSWITNQMYWHEQKHDVLCLLGSLGVLICTLSSQSWLTARFPGFKSCGVDINNEGTGRIKSSSYKNTNQPPQKLCREVSLSPHSLRMKGRLTLWMIPAEWMYCKTQEPLSREVTKVSDVWCQEISLPLALWASDKPDTELFPLTVAASSSASPDLSPWTASPGSCR